MSGSMARSPVPAVTVRLGPVAACAVPVASVSAASRTANGAKRTAEWYAPPRSETALRLAQALDDHRLALAARDAHGLETDRAVEGVQVVEQRGHDANAGHPERMAEGDRAAVRV